MKVKSLVLITTLLSFSLASNAQKIKYKDLYPILAAKQYDEGIPQLVKYLAIEENKEEANPNLQMGLWLHDRFLKLDDTSSTKFTEVGDSALYFLEKSIVLIDEKEVKKKGEYYQEFLRRDLRSGKFLIKVSDIHLDIENRIEGIKTRMESK